MEFAVISGFHHVTLFFLSYKKPPIHYTNECTGKLLIHIIWRKSFVTSFMKIYSQRLIISSFARNVFFWYTFARNSWKEVSYIYIYICGWGRFWIYMLFKKKITASIIYNVWLIRNWESSVEGIRDEIKNCQKDECIMRTTDWTCLPTLQYYHRR